MNFVELVVQFWPKLSGESSTNISPTCCSLTWSMPSPRNGAGSKSTSTPGEESESKCSPNTVIRPSLSKP